MNKEAQQYDPRYYYMRIIDLKIKSEAKFKSEKVQVKLQLGTKYSETIFELADLQQQLERQKIAGEAHIFKYGGEEFLNLYLEEVTASTAHKKEEENKVQSHQAPLLSGYCRILLPPLIQYPHICHQISAQFISVKDKIQFTHRVLAQITVQLYYRLDFKGYIDIIPMGANLERNVAQFGQMKPIVQLTLQGRTWTSLEAQGIHPRWSGHFNAKKEKIQATKSHYILKNIQGNLKSNNYSLEQRRLFLAESLTTKQSYFDIVKFPLKSAGSFLAIKIYSYPLIGSAPDIVGQAEIRISNAGFFKHPKDAEQYQFVEKEIKLFINEDEEKINTGNFTLLIRFVFDKKLVLDCGPYLQQMPKPTIELQDQRLRREERNGFQDKKI